MKKEDLWFQLKLLITGLYNVLWLLFFVLFLTFCKSNSDKGIEQSFFVKHTSLKIPDSVISFNGKEERTMNFLLYGRVEMTNKQYSEFIDLNKIEVSSLKNFDSFNFSAYKPDENWWDYSQNTNTNRFYSQEWKNNKWNCSLNIAVQPKPNSYILYVIYVEEP